MIHDSRNYNSMIPILANQQLKNPVSVRKKPCYFEQKMELCEKNAIKQREFYLSREHGRKKNIKNQRGSFALLAKMGKSHTIAERLLKLATFLCVKELQGKEAAHATQKSSLSKDPVRRRQNKMADILKYKLAEN